MKNNLVDLNERRENEMRDAYKWCLEFQRQHAFYSEPIELVLDMGDAIKDDSVTISLFVDASTGQAIIRRDWFEQMTIRFNTLVNLEEVKKKAPNTYERLVQNGLDLYRKDKQIRR